MLAVLGACHHQADDGNVHDTALDVSPVGVQVRVEVNGAVVFEGLADRPSYGLYQPPRPNASCLPARRIAAIQGSEIWVEMVFPGEVPTPGAQVRFPSEPDSDAPDWSAATWTDASGQSWAVYGGLATLDAFSRDEISMRLQQATVCRSERVGWIDPQIDGTWSTHISDCQPDAQVVFRTLEPLPFELDRPPQCAEGRALSWQTREGDPLCSFLTEPCELED